MKLPMKGLRDFIYYTQMGFSLVLPPLLLIWLSLWLRRVFHLGVWLTVVAIVFGMVVLCATAYSYFKEFRKKQEKQEDQDTPPINFNSHD